VPWHRQRRNERFDAPDKVFKPTS
jgi:hypothetical protein